MTPASPASSTASLFHVRHDRRKPGDAAESDQPLVLVHGLGSSGASWDRIVVPLARHREVVVVDLAGHGSSPDPATTTIAALADSLERFLDEELLRHADLVGSSLGARLVLEKLRRGHQGGVVALDPGGFWHRPGALYLGATLGLSARLLRLVEPALPALCRNALARTVLLVQLSARPWRVGADDALAELQRYARNDSFDGLLHDLVASPAQLGVSVVGRVPPLSIVWGRRDRVAPRRQARRAVAAFPGAHLTYFERCGHFPQWDQPQRTVDHVLSATARVPQGPPAGSADGDADGSDR